MAARCVAVMRDIAAKNQNIRFHAIGRAVGLIGEDEPWKAWRRQQVADICQFAAAAGVHACGGETLEWQRVVDGQGNPLKGVTRDSRLVSIPDKPRGQRSRSTMSAWRRVMPGHDSAVCVEEPLLPAFHGFDTPPQVALAAP
jgi:hypothetical protein